MTDRRPDMTKIEALTDLLVKVKAGEQLNDSTDAAMVERAFGTSEFTLSFAEAYMGSLDAAMALHEAVLPGWGYRVGPQYAIVLDPGPIYGVPRKDKDGLSQDNPARAWLIAIIEALIAQEKTDDQ